MGLEPIYGGRAAGSFVFGRMLYGLMVNDSAAWVSTSRPVFAVTAAGADREFSGSTSATVGRMCWWEMPVFTCRSRKSMTMTVVVSLPVPAVVGRAINGFSGPGTGVPLPMGAFTYSSRSAG